MKMRLLLTLIFAFLILMALLPEDESKKEDPVSTPEVVEELPKIKHKKSVILDAKVLVKKEGFFVALKVDAYELAKLNFRYTCNHPGFFSADTKQCSPEELSGKMKEALSRDYYLSLYGKYYNRWVLFKKEDEIPSTVKFNGYSISEFKRSLDNIDSIILGPIPEKPTKVLLWIDNQPDKADANFDETFLNPSFDIN